MSTTFAFPKKKAVIFWPVGTGDSTTLILKPDSLVMQIDLRHLEKADDEENPEWPIVDHLVKCLPKRDGNPYLAVFVLTHPDKDHIQGFAELLRRVHIGEIWHTPKIFRDQKDEESLCADAKAFRREAHRRRKATGDNPTFVKSGNRLRVIGHDDILNEQEYKRLPANCKSRPGEKVSLVDNNDLAGHFQAFIHAPFSADQAKDKNNTSLALNIVLWEGNNYGQFFFFGDREYPTVKRIFEETERNNTNIAYLYWDALLSPHHCSKGVMYWQNEGEKEKTFKKDVMDYLEKYSRDRNGYIVASALSDYTSGEGDNPPHSKARQQYEKIVKAGHYICTHEYPTNKSPGPLVFTIGTNGFEFDDNRSTTKGPLGLATAVEAARGISAPPATQTTFGSDE